MTVALLKEQFEEILEEVSVGVSLRAAMASRGLEPKCFYRYINADENACQQYARAKTQSGHAIAEQTWEIQDEEPPKVSTQFGEHVDSAWVQWQKNRVELRRWHLAKLMPKVYGEKINIEAEAGNITVEINEGKA